MRGNVVSSGRVDYDALTARQGSAGSEWSEGVPYGARVDLRQVTTNSAMRIAIGEKISRCIER
jgi:hypothetical protein